MVAWALSLAAGVVAGLASWFLLELFHERLQPGLLNTPGLPTVEEATAAAVSRVAAYAREAAIAFGALGAALGVALGLTGGLLSRSIHRAGIAALAGHFLGGAVGALTSWILTPLFYRWYDPDADSFVLVIAIQGVLGAAIGAGGGVAFGLGLGERSRILGAAMGGLLGALLGVLLFQIISAVVFPLDGTSRLISSTWTTRLFARLAVAVLAAVGAVKGAWTTTAR